MSRNVEIYIDYGKQEEVHKKNLILVVSKSFSSRLCKRTKKKTRTQNI